MHRDLRSFPTRRSSDLEDLDPVAGRRHLRLADVVAADQLVQRLDGVVGTHRELLEQRHGSGLVAHPDGQETHAVTSTVGAAVDRKSTRLNSSHANISYAVFCLKKKKNTHGERD